MDKFDELDPVHGELEMVSDEAQFRYLLSLEAAIDQVEFTYFLKHLNTAPVPPDHLHELAHEEAYLGLERRQRRFAHYLRYQSSKREKKAREKAQRFNANLVSALRKTVSEETVGGSVDDTFSANFEAMELTDWWNRSMGQFEGLAYSTTISRYEASQALDDASPTKFSGSALRASKREQEARAKLYHHTQHSDNQKVIGFNAFNPLTLRQRLLEGVEEDPMLGQLQREEFDKLTDAQVEVLAGHTTHQDYVDCEAEYRAAVDSGTTVTITKLSPKQLAKFCKVARTKIRGFDGNITVSSGEGIIVGSMLSEEGKVVPIVIPRAHTVATAPENLLSVSVMVSYGYEFHFTRSRSWLVTPTLEVVELEQKGGLFWLTWKPLDSISDDHSAAASEISTTSTAS